MSVSEYHNSWLKNYLNLWNVDLFVIKLRERKIYYSKEKHDKLQSSEEFLVRYRKHINN